jgi:hypothetical protein
VADLSRSYLFGNPLQALTREGVVSDVIFDQTFTKSGKLFQYMLQKGMVDDKRGGAALTWNNNFGTSPNTVAFDGDDPLPIASLTNNLQRAALPWRSYADALVLPINDILDNEDSPEAIASLVEAQLDITKMSIVDKLAQDIITNTPSINPKGLDGFAEAIDSGTVAPTYAGIGRTQFGTRWQSTVNYAVPSSTSLLNTIHSNDLNASVDNQRPDAYFCNILLFASLVESLFAQDAYIQPEMARAAGGNDLIFNGNPLFIDNHIPTGVSSPTTAGSYGQFLGINSSYVRLVINPKARFAVSDWIAAQNNATVFVRIFFRGNLVVLKPAAHFTFWYQGV